MLLAVAAVSLRYRAFPLWFGWVAVAAAVAQALLWLATVIQSGPLASDSWLSFALYPFFLVWVVQATVIMMRRAARRRRLRRTPINVSPGYARSRESERRSF
jgi:hypothetical protein